MLCTSGLVRSWSRFPPRMLAALLALVPSLVGVRLAPPPGVPSIAASSACRMGTAVPAMVLSRDKQSLGSLTGLQQASGDGARPKVEVIVAGGGIGGLCTALVLTNMGYDVRVFEKTKQCATPRAERTSLRLQTPSPSENLT